MRSRSIYRVKIWNFKQKTRKYGLMLGKSRVKYEGKIGKSSLNNWNTISPDHKEETSVLSEIK
jgi:hypothetical protein